MGKPSYSENGGFVNKYYVEHSNTWLPDIPIRVTMSMNEFFLDKFNFNANNYVVVQNIIFSSDKCLMAINKHLLYVNIYRGKFITLKRYII